MTILKDFSVLWSFLHTLLLFLLLFESRYSKKKTLILSLATMIPLILVNTVIFVLVGTERYMTALLLTCSLPSLIFFWILAKKRDGRFFFTFCFADTLMLEIIYLTSILDFFLGNTYIFMAVSRLILCPLVALAVWKWLRTSYMELQNHVQKGWYIFAAIALIFYILMSMAATVPTHITQRPEYIPAFILLLVLLPVIYLHIFTTLHRQQLLYEAREKENILNVQVQSLRSRIDEFSTANALFREERHDFRHKMRTMATLAEKGRLSEVQVMAQEYAESLPEKTAESYCSHTILDAVLSSYLQWAKRKGIRVTTNLDFPDPLPVNETELATAFANALENAIQACEKIEPAKRYIEVKAITDPQFILQVRNSFDGMIAFDEKGIPLSTKKGHGFGTRSIVTFCEKNNAFYEFGTEGETFYMWMMFQ